MWWYTLAMIYFRVFTILFFDILSSIPTNSNQQWYSTLWYTHALIYSRVFTILFFDILSSIPTNSNQQWYSTLWYTHAMIYLVFFVNYCTPVFTDTLLLLLQRRWASTCVILTLDFLKHLFLRFSVLLTPRRFVNQQKECLYNHI